MKLLDFFRGMVKPKASASLEEMLRHGSDTASGAVVTMESAMKVAVAWRCIQVISGAIGSMPFDIVRRADEHRRYVAAGHPLRQVLTVRPNKWQTPREFRQMLQAHLLLRGNGYARKVYTGKNVTALLPLHPDRVQPKQLPDMSMQYQVSTSNGQSIILPQNEIMHLRGMTLDGVTGLSPLTYMREALGLSLQGEKAAAKAMKNGTFAPGTLNHPNKLSQESRQNLKATWDTRSSGVDNAGSTPLLEEGLEYKVVGFSAADMQFLEMRAFQRNDVAMFFGTPAHIVGIPGAASNWGTGIEQQQIGFVTFTLTDWLNVWEETINRDLLNDNDKGDLSAKFYTNGLLRGDLKTRKEFYVAMLQWGVFNPNMVLALEDQPPRSDGMGDKYYDPPNVGTTKEQSSDEPEKNSDV